MDHAVAFAYTRRRFADVHRFARLRAGKRLGIKNRDYRAYSGFTPDPCELQAFVQRQGDNAGFAGKPVQPHRVLDPLAPSLLDVDLAGLRPIEASHRRAPTKDDYKFAARDMKYVAFGLFRAPRRKYSPSWSLPAELFCVIVSPAWLSKPERRRPILGVDAFEKSLDDPKDPSFAKRRRLVEAQGLTAGRKKTLDIQRAAALIVSLPPPRFAAKCFLPTSGKAFPDVRG